MYVNGKNIDIKKLFGPLEFKGSKLQVGKSNFEIWSEWRQASLIGLQGEVSFNDLMLQSRGMSQLVGLGEDSPAKKGQAGDKTQNKINSVEYQNLAGRFAWNKYDNGWKIQTDKLVLRSSQKSWPEPASRPGVTQRLICQ